MIDRERDHILGTGPLELLVYGDYQCPYTRNALESIAHLRDRLGERLTFAFRHFPLRHKHARAQAAAEAVEAADAQGRFWAMHEALLRHPGKLSDEELRRWAVEALLDLPRFEADMEAGVGRDRIREDIESRTRAAVDRDAALLHRRRALPRPLRRRVAVRGTDGAQLALS